VAVPHAGNPSVFVLSGAGAMASRTDLADYFAGRPPRKSVAAGTGSTILSSSHLLTPSPIQTEIKMIQASYCPTTESQMACSWSREIGRSWRTASFLSVSERSPPS